MSSLRGISAMLVSKPVRAGLASRAPVMCRLRAVTLAAGILMDVAENDWTARIGALLRRAEAML